MKKLDIFWIFIVFFNVGCTLSKFDENFTYNISVYDYVSNLLGIWLVTYIIMKLKVEKQLDKIKSLYSNINTLLTKNHNHD